MQVIDKKEFFEVLLEESLFKVYLDEITFEKLGKGRTKEEFIKDCFDFLLEREPKEMILKEFNIKIISKYFPEFEEKI